MDASDERRIVAIEGKVEKHHVDLYEGRGKDNPSITARMDLMEYCVQSISKNLNRMTWLLLATLLTGLGDLVIRKMH